VSGLMTQRNAGRLYLSECFYFFGFLRPTGAGLFAGAVLGDRDILFFIFITPPWPDSAD